MSSPKDTPGFFFPINHSVNVVKMYAGVPAGYMMANVLLSFMLSNYLSWYFLVVFPLLHIVGRILTIKDRRFVGIFADYLQQRPSYD